MKGTSESSAHARISQYSCDERLGGDAEQAISIYHAIMTDSRTDQKIPSSPAGIPYICCRLSRVFNSGTDSHGGQSFELPVPPVLTLLSMMDEACHKVRQKRLKAA